MKQSRVLLASDFGDVPDLGAENIDTVMSGNFTGGDTDLLSAWLETGTHRTHSADSR